VKTLARAIYCNFDPAVRDNLAMSVGCRATEIYALMRKMGAEINRREEEDPGNPVHAQDFMFDLFQDGELSDSALLYLMLYGTKELWASYAQGVLLALDAEKLEREEKEANGE